MSSESNKTMEVGCIGSLACETVNKGYRGWFVLLLLCWLVLMVWPCLMQSTTTVSRADNAIMTLMAAVILAATHTALRAGDRFHSGLFSSAELLYCGAY